MNVWLDDERPMPQGYDLHVQTAQEAIQLLSQGGVVRISLDHDLGEQGGTGYEVACFLEQSAYNGTLQPVEVLIHSANPVGRENIRRAVAKAYEYWSSSIHSKQHESRLSPFVHLHVHTEYSLPSSTIRIPELVAKAQEYGMSAVAITDNNVCGAVEFYRACRKSGIKPIIGAEIPVASVLQREKPDQDFYTLVLLCMDMNGYCNLCRILSEATGQGLTDCTPVSPVFLSAHSDGLICLSGGRNGELTNACRRANDDAVQVADWYCKHFSGRYYIELFPEPTRDLATLCAIAENLAIPLVAASNCRCICPEAPDFCKVRPCMRKGARLDRDGKKPSVEPYFHTPELMHEMFGDRQEALANTMLIANRCNLELSEEFAEAVRLTAAKLN